MATSGATAAGGAGGAHAATDARPEFCVLVHGVAKKQNIGNMLRSACAFGVAQVLVTISWRIKETPENGRCGHRDFNFHHR